MSAALALAGLVLAAYLAFGFVCAAVLLLLAVLPERRRHPEITGIAPPGHPDLDVTLSDDERDELDGIAAGWDRTGLAIFESTEGEAS